MHKFTRITKATKTFSKSKTYSRLIQALLFPRLALVFLAKRIVGEDDEVSDKVG